MYAKMPRPQRPLEDLGEDCLVRIEFLYVTSLADVRRHCAAAFDAVPAVPAAGQTPGLGASAGLSSPVAAVPYPALIVVEDDALDDAADRLEAASTMACLDASVAWARAELPGAADAAFVYVSSAHGATAAAAPLALSLAVPLRLLCTAAAGGGCSAVLESDVAPLSAAAGLPATIRYTVGEESLTVVSVAAGH